MESNISAVVPAEESTSQSERKDYGNGPMTAEVSLATSRGLENLPL